jgi:steroid delta-isomerase-like uncharacterized protein
VSEAMIETTQLLDEWAESWSSHDMDGVLALYTDDCVYEDVPLGVVNHGKEELKAFASSFFSAAPDLKVEIRSRFACGDVGGLEWVFSGTQTGDLPNMPASGRSFSLRGASICEARGGKLARVCDYWDLNTFLKQLGFLS